MNIKELTAKLFPEGCEFCVESNVLIGSARVRGERVEVLGIVDEGAIGVDEALRMSKRVLDIVREKPAAPMVMLIATKGQKMQLRDELLGLNQYLAHLCKCQEIARQNGHRIVAVVYGLALGGGFIATGLMADVVIALEEANPMVMPIKEIACVTKLPLPFLEELSTRNPVFAPGADSFFKMGGLHLLRPVDAAGALAEVLALGGSAESVDRRGELAAACGRRLLAKEVADKVVALP
jgi:malonate decarboxylase gamma subunit